MTESAGRKRARKVSPGSEDEDASKKHRGRPRVDTQDETAADRRRTQIRLAQRAYRSRKEQTISSLNEKVADLESTIEEMANAFMSFNDKALASDIIQRDPDLAEDLRRTVQRFVQLAPSQASHDGIETTREQPARLADTKQMPTPSTATEESGPPVQTFEEMRTPWGGYRSMAEINSVAKSNAATSEGTSKPAQLPFGLVHPVFDPDLSDLEIPDNIPSLDSLISDPAKPPLPQLQPLPPGPSPAQETSPDANYVYSFQESTFARRIHRAALEHGFHVISRQQEDGGARFRWAFRLCLLYNTQDLLLAKFKNLLRVGTSAPLGYRQSPFIHLGGAGLHYPRKHITTNFDQDGRELKGNSFVPEPIDMRRPSLVRLKAIDSDDTLVPSDIVIDVSGYEGEWFDPNDVQCYLEEHGLVIDPQASFVEGDARWSCMANIDRLCRTPRGNEFHNEGGNTGVSASTVTSPSDTRDEPRTPLQPNQMFSEAEIQSFTSFMDGLIGIPDFASSSAGPTDGQTDGGVLGNGAEFSFFDTEKSIPSERFQDFKIGGCSRHRGTYTTPEERTVRITVDISKLVEELMKYCICLGKTPGFRRTDVDRALAAALIQIQQ